MKLNALFKKKIAREGSRTALGSFERMTGLAPKADVRSQPLYVAKVPTADSCVAAICGSFDHLVGPAEQRERNCKAK